MPFIKGSAPYKRGHQRMAELGAEMRTAVADNSAAMLKDLGHPVTVAERFVAEAICALYLRASRLRSIGRDDSTVLAQAAQLQQSSVFACRPIQPAVEPEPV